MAMTDLTIITRSMTARLFSTLTTILTVAVAVGLMLLLLSLRKAGEEAFSRGSGNMHLLVSRESSALVSVLNGIFYANAPQRPIDWAKYEQITSSYPLNWAIPTQLGDSYRGHPVMATTREFFTKFQPDQDRPWALRAGRYFDAPFEVVLGSSVARRTGLRLGEKIVLTHGIGQEGHEHPEFQYEVVGILEPTGSSHDRALFTDLESTWIIHAHDRRLVNNPNASRTTSADLTPADRLITGIYIALPTRDGSQVTAVLQQVFDMMRRDTSITVAQPGAETKKLFDIIRDMNLLFVGMAGVVMVSSGISIMLALYNSMEQRRRQIAVLRVLGCSRPRVSSLVLTESAMIGLLGAAAGIAAWAIGAQVAAAILKDLLGLVVTPRLDAATTLNVVMATIALASLAGIVPSIAAYRTPVARHLRPIG